MARPRSLIHAVTEILARGKRVMLEYTNAHAID